MLESCEKRPGGKKDALRAFRSQLSACSQQTERPGTGTHPHAPSPAVPATVTSRPACEGALASREGLGDHAGHSSCHPVNEKGLTCFCPGWRVSSPTLSLLVRLASPCTLFARFQHLSHECHRRRRLHAVPSTSYFITSGRWEGIMQNAQFHQVVIIGGGFAGLYAAKALRRAPVRVMLVDKRNFHLFQPLLYQVATGSLSPGDISYPLGLVFAHDDHLAMIMAEVIDIDVSHRTVILHDGSLTYDTLIIATGASHQYFGHNEWAQTAPGLKTIEDAPEIRRRIFSD